MSKRYSPGSSDSIGPDSGSSMVELVSSLSMAESQPPRGTPLPSSYCGGRRRERAEVDEPQYGCSRLLHSPVMVLKGYSSSHLTSSSSSLQTMASTLGALVHPSAVLYPCCGPWISADLERSRLEDVTKIQEVLQCLHVELIGLPADIPLLSHGIRLGLVRLHPRLEQHLGCRGHHSVALLHLFGFPCLLPAMTKWAAFV